MSAEVLSPGYRDGQEEPELGPGRGGVAGRRLRGSADGVRLVLALALLVGVVVPVVLAAVSGNLWIPHNDAWSYSRIAQTFGRTGDIELLGWNRSALFGQFLVLGPLARWLVVQQLFVALLAGVGLLACYDLLAPVVGRRRASFGTLLVAAWPGFGLLATTFMSDVPATTAMVVCLALGRRALRGGSVGLLVASTGVGWWGVTIREQAVAAPVAVLSAAVLGARAGRVTLRWPAVAGAAGGLVVASGLFEVWRHSFPGGDPPRVVDLSWLSQAEGTLAGGYFLLALVLAPAVAVAAQRRRWGRRAWMLAVAAAGAAVAAVHDRHPHGFFVGNYLDPSGPYWAAGNGHPAAIFPTVVWWGVVGLACTSGVVLAGVLAQRLFALDALMGSFLLLEAGGTLVTGLSGQSIFDRYWLVLVVPLLGVVLGGPTGPRPHQGQHRSPGVGPARRSLVRVAAGALCAVLVLFSLAVTAAGMAYDTARWRAGQHLVAEGVPATDVNAGLEWVGYHSPAGMQPADSWHFPGTEACYAVTAAPRRGQRSIQVRTYRTFLVVGTSHLWIYDDRVRPAMSCPG